MGNERRLYDGVVACNVHVNICDPEVACVLCLKCGGLLTDILYINQEIIENNKQLLFFPMARQPLGGLGRLIFRGGLLWTRDQLVAETYT
jgi:hypothetical protein